MFVVTKRQIIGFEFTFRILVIADNKEGKNLVYKFINI